MTSNKTTENISVVLFEKEIKRNLTGILGLGKTLSEIKNSLNQLNIWMQISYKCVSEVEYRTI